MHIPSWLTGAIAGLVLSAFVRALPDPPSPCKGFLQGLYLWFFNFTHFILANYDRIKTGAGGITPTKYTGILLVLFAVALCGRNANAQAQPTDQVLPTYMVDAYLGVNSEASTNPFGGANLGRQIKGPLYSLSGYDVTAVPGQTMKIGSINAPKLKFTNWSGLAYQVTQFGTIKGWLKGAPGLATNGDAVGVSWNAGGFLTWAGKKGWGAMIGLDWIRDVMSGDGYVIRIGPHWEKR